MDLRHRIWLVGRTGRIGTALNVLLNQSKELNYQIIATDVDDIDITNLDEVERFVERNRPTIIINSASKRDKKWCEENIDLAFRINSIGARNLAIASDFSGAHLIHISTDFVFDGKNNEAYNEYDELNPLSIYGKTMALAEKLINQHCNRFTIIRNSRLYGKRKIKDIIKQARENKKVVISENITGSPVSTLYLAEKVISFIDTYQFGTFHLSSKEEVSAKRFVEEVLDILDIKAEIEILDNEEYAVPKKVIFDNLMLRLIEKDDSPNWKEDLRRFIKERKVV